MLYMYIYLNISALSEGPERHKCFMLFGLRKQSACRDAPPVAELFATPLPALRTSLHGIMGLTLLSMSSHER